MSVSTGPGPTALQVIPWRANSSAQVLVRPMRAALVAE